MATPQADEQEGTGSAGGSILSRHPAVLALGGGVAAAFGSSFIPMNAIEGFVTAYGIAELLPAAAPPLGDTARLALSAGIGTLTAGALLALLPRAESDDMGFETSIRKAVDTGAANSQPVAPAAKSGKLAGWLRTLRFGKSDPAPGTITDFADLAPPRIRNGDQHPDAPVRAPIRASADLGAPLVPGEAANAEAPLELGESMSFAEPEPAVQPVAPSLRFAPPAAAPLPEEPIAVEMPERPLVLDAAPPFAGNAIADHEDTPEPAPITATAAPPTAPSFDNRDIQEIEAETIAELREQPAEDLEALSVVELLARLETGLERRRQRARTEQPPALPADSGARVLSLAKPAFAESGETPSPFRLRLGGFAERDAEPDAAAASPGEAPELADRTEPVPASRSQPLWDEDAEYLPPSVSGTAPELDEFAPVAIEAAPTEDTAPAAVQDDDMDAALRNALATLRQLSDRPRGA